MTCYCRVKVLPDEFCYLTAQAMSCHLASVVAPPRLDVPAEGVTRALIALFAGKILVAIAQVTTCPSSCVPFVRMRLVICHSAVRLLLLFFPLVSVVLSPLFFLLCFSQIPLHTILPS